MKSVVMRSLVICCVTAIALIIPDFTIFTDIAGALGAGVIAFVLPPLLYNVQFKDSVSTARKWFHYFIVLFGVVGIIISLVSSFITIAQGKA